MDYQVKPVGKNCSATGKPFSPGDLCHSVLLDDHGEIVRFDYSVDGWPGEPPAESVAHWQTVIPTPESDDQPKPLDAESLFEFFEQMIEDANPAQEKINYVVALLLMQKKRLNLYRNDDEATLRLLGSQGEGPYLIPDQKLADNEIQQLQQELATAIFR